MRKLLLAGAGAVVLVVVVLGARALAEERRTIAEIQALRDGVYAARVSADSCRNELAYAETRFRRFDAVVDSLRQEVRGYEALDPRGVPEERYDEYMERFDGYNDSVAVWEARAEALRAADETCRSLVVRHNELADTLRGRLTEFAPPGS